MKGDTKEKTEQPSAKRLRDARKKGSVAKSSDLVSGCTFAILVIMIGVFHEYFFNRLDDITGLLGRNFNLPAEKAIGFAVMVTFRNVVFIILPVLAVTIFSVVVFNLLQFGLIVSVEPITPKIDKINPVEGFKRIFSLETLLESIKSIIKVTMLGLILYFAVKSMLSYLVHLPNYGLDAIIRAWLRIISTITIIAAFFSLLIGFLDVLLQKRLYLRRNKMSKDEVRREFKDTEGNPLIKGRRRIIYQQMLSEQTIKNAGGATVIITNPVHYAVALYYKRKVTGLPMVVTKGEHLQAREIIKIAETAKVPVIRNVPLARALYHQVQIGDYIPGDLLEPVAEIIRWVFMNFPEAGLPR